MTRVTLLMEVDLELIRDEDIDGYVAAFRPLGVFGQGSTEEEAIKDFEKALEVTIHACLKRGCLEQALAEAGLSWERLPSKNPPGERLPRPVGPPGRQVSIPIPWVVQYAVG